MSYGELRDYYRVNNLLEEGYDEEFIHQTTQLSHNVIRQYMELAEERPQAALLAIWQYRQANEHRVTDIQHNIKASDERTAGLSWTAYLVILCRQLPGDLYCGSAREQTPGHATGTDRYSCWPTADPPGNSIRAP